MPCGGIYPVKRVPGDCPDPSADRCFYCSKAEPQVDHFVEEWDAYIHGPCVKPFLKTEEGKTVLNHGHSVRVLKNGEICTLSEEMPAAPPAPPTAPIPAPAPSYKRYEYMVTSYDENAEARWELWLDFKGEDGWLLVHVLPLPSGWFRCTFVREKR